MTKKVPKKILRIERHFFVNLRKKLFLAAHAAPRRRRRRFFWTGGAPPPPTEIDRRAAADTMTSAHSSTLTREFLPRSRPAGRLFELTKSPLIRKLFVRDATRIHFRICTKEFDSLVQEL